MLSNWTEFIRLNRNESLRFEKREITCNDLYYFTVQRDSLQEKAGYTVTVIFFDQSETSISCQTKKMIIIEKKNIFWIPYTSIEIHIDASFLFMIIIIIFFVICFDDECSYQAISSLFTALYTYFSTY